jgi:hypothetical protein
MQLFIRHKYTKISPAHRQKRIFMHNISKKNYNQQILQYSKSTKTKKNNRRHNEDHGMRRCAKNAKISGEIHEKNTQHDMIKMQRCVYGREREASLQPIEILSGCVT